MHYYQFNIGDYASHTRNLSFVEDLIYRRLLDEYYLHERPLNASVAIVARQIGMKEYEGEVNFVLESFFELADNGWQNARAQREIDAYHAKSEQASRAGKASAEARLNKRSTTVQPNINHKPINIKQETDKTRASRLEQDWKPDERMLAFCESERPDLNPQQVADSFRDYWIAQPGSKGRKVDWEATWRNWVRNQRQGNKGDFAAKMSNGMSANQLTVLRMLGSGDAK